MVRNKENSEERPDDKKATSLPACEVVGLPGGCSNSFFSTVFFIHRITTHWYEKHSLISNPPFLRGR